MGFILIISPHDTFHPYINTGPLWPTLQLLTRPRFVWQLPLTHHHYHRHCSSQALLSHTQNYAKYIVGTCDIPSHWCVPAYITVYMMKRRNTTIMPECGVDIKSCLNSNIVQYFLILSNVFERLFGSSTRSKYKKKLFDSPLCRPRLFPVNIHYTKIVKDIKYP